MSLSAAVIDAMVQAGCTAEQLGAAMKASLADEEARRESKRANNAERQRRFKARHKQEVTDDNADNALSSVTPLSRPPNENNSNPPTHTPGDKTPARKGRTETPTKPDGVQDQTWVDFLDLRKRKGSPLSETALVGIKREADKAGWGLDAALAESVTRGWQAFKADWVAERKPPNRDPPSYLDHALAKQTVGAPR